MTFCIPQEDFQKKPPNKRVTTVVTDLSMHEYLFWAVLGLCYYTQAFSSCGEGDYSG